MIVDVHTHFLPSHVVDADDLNAPDIHYDVRIGEQRDAASFTGRGRAAGFVVAQLVDPARRLLDMDRMGVDVQVLSVPPPFGFFYTQDLETSQQWCRVLNEGIAEAVATKPERFIGLATVPLHYPEAAVEALEDALTHLGLRGVEIATRVGESNLDNPAFRPFFAAAERLQAVVFVHSTRGLGAARLADYHFGNLIGNPTEDAIATASLIFGGVVRDFPDLQLYIAHGGGASPSMAGRWDHGWLVRPEGSKNISQPPSSYLRQLSFDSVTHGVGQLELLVKVSAANVLLGSDYPYDMSDPDPVRGIRAAILTEEQRLRILEGNAARFFRL